MDEKPPPAAEPKQLAMDFAAPPKKGCPKCGLTGRHTPEKCEEWAAWRARERLRFFSLEW